LAQASNRSSRSESADKARAAEQRKADERRREAAAEQRKAEERRQAAAAEQRKAEERRKEAAAQQRRASEERKATEERRTAEERRAAEERKTADRQREAADQQRRAAEQQRLAAEEQRKATVRQQQAVEQQNRSGRQTTGQGTETRSQQAVETRNPAGRGTNGDSRSNVGNTNDTRGAGNNVGNANNTRGAGNNVGNANDTRGGRNNAGTGTNRDTRAQTPVDRARDVRYEGPARSEVRYYQVSTRKNGFRFNHDYERCHFCFGVGYTYGHDHLHRLRCPHCLGRGFDIEFHVGLYDICPLCYGNVNGYGFGNRHYDMTDIARRMTEELDFVVRLSNSQERRIYRINLDYLRKSRRGELAYWIERRDNQIYKVLTYRQRPLYLAYARNIDYRDVCDHCFAVYF